jgi:phage N-6-adenine-methyltransferase
MSAGSLQVKGMHSKDSDVRATPQKIFDDLNAEFRFDLDPCATPENAKCDLFYTPDQDGLRNAWNGRVFCNPPYSEIRKWMVKGHEETTLGTAELVVFLVPSRTGTDWWHDYAQHHEIRWLRGRIQFNDCGRNAPFDCCLVIMRATEAAS